VLSFSQHPPFERVLLHISDTHLLGGDRKLYGSIDVSARLEALFQRVLLTEDRIDALVFTGDLTERGEIEAYEALVDLVKPFASQLGAEIIWVMGNHDEIEPFARVLFGEQATNEPQDRVYDLAGLRVIALDTTVPGYHHGELSQAQLQWLGEQLATPAPLGTLLAVHHPPIPTPNALMGVIELEDQAALAAVVGGTDVRGVLAGHLHYSTFSTFAGVPISVCAAACYTVDPLPDSTSMLSAVTGGASVSLVHVYPDQVVFSSVPLEAGIQVASQSAEQQAMVEAFTPEQRREILSNKNSEFNQAVDSKQAGE
jgi:Icc protein